MAREIDAGLTFALDFSTALLANILHAQSTHTHLLDAQNRKELVDTSRAPAPLTPVASYKVTKLQS